MNRETVAQDLAQALFRRCHVRGINAVSELLLEPTGIESASWITTRNWYAEQTEASKRFVDLIVQQAVKFSVVNAAVLLDGDSGFIDVGEGRGEIVVNVRVFNNVENAMHDIVEEVVPVCPPDDGIPIHDYLLDLIDNWSNHRGK